MKGSKKILSGLRPDYLTDPWSGILIPAPPCLVDLTVTRKFVITTTNIDRDIDQD